MVFQAPGLIDLREPLVKRELGCLRLPEYRATFNLLAVLREST
jgi:hypothetical protein